MATSEFFGPSGTNLARFVANNKERLKNKHLICIIRSNVRSDRFVYKTGKTTAGPSRLTSYVHTHGFQKKGQPQAGAVLMFYQIVAAREPGVGGTPLVSRYEKALEMAMALAGAKRAHGRGRERWRATPNQVAEAVESLPEVWKDFNADYSSDLVRQQPPREATTRGACECERVETKVKGKRCPTVKCVPKIRLVPQSDPPGKAPAPRTTSGPRFAVDQHVRVRYEDGKDHAGVVKRVTQAEIDVLFSDGLATIPRKQWWLVKKTKQ